MAAFMSVIFSFREEHLILAERGKIDVIKINDDDDDDDDESSNNSNNLVW